MQETAKNKKTMTARETWRAHKVMMTIFFQKKQCNEHVLGLEPRTREKFASCASATCAVCCSHLQALIYCKAITCKLSQLHFCFWRRRNEESQCGGQGLNNETVRVAKNATRKKKRGPPCLQTRADDTKAYGMWRIPQEVSLRRRANLAERSPSV